MTDRIKLSELVAAREVARGPWEVQHVTAQEIPACTSFPHGYYRSPETLVYDDGNSFVRSTDDGSPADWDDAYAEYVVKMHNAADVLIEIAQAALAFRAARDPDTEFEMRDRLDSALAKVQP